MRFHYLLGLHSAVVLVLDLAQSSQEDLARTVLCSHYLGHRNVHRADFLEGLRIRECMTRSSLAPPVIEHVLLTVDVASTDCHGCRHWLNIRRTRVVHRSHLLLLPLASRFGESVDTSMRWAAAHANPSN